MLLLKVNTTTKNLWLKNVMKVKVKKNLTMKNLMMKDSVDRNACAQVPQRITNASAAAPHRTKMVTVNSITT